MTNVTIVVVIRVGLLCLVVGFIAGLYGKRMIGFPLWQHPAGAGDL